MLVLLKQSVQMQLYWYKCAEATAVDLLMNVYASVCLYKGCTSVRISVTSNHTITWQTGFREVVSLVSQITLCISRHSI